MSESEGVRLFVTWGLVEWVGTAMFTIGMAVFGWVWNLSGRIVVLEESSRSKREELDVLRRTLREIGNALDKKIDNETERLEERMERVSNKVDDMSRELPSRAFIEGQLHSLTERLDRSMDVKLAGR